MISTKISLFSLCLCTTLIHTMEPKSFYDSTIANVAIKRPAQLKDLAYHRDDEQFNGVLLYNDGHYIPFNSHNKTISLRSNTPDTVSAIALMKTILIKGTNQGTIGFTRESYEQNITSPSFINTPNKYTFSKSAITSLAYSPQQKKLFIGTHNGKIKIWDITKETSTTISTHHNDPIKQVLPHPQNGICTWITTNGQLCHNDTKERNIHVLSNAIIPYNTQQRVIDFNTSGTILGIQSANNTVTNYNFRTNAIHNSIPIPTTSHWGFCFIGEKRILHWNNAKQSFYDIEKQETISIKTPNFNTEQNSFNPQYQEVFTAGYQPDTHNISMNFRSFQPSTYHPIMQWDKAQS